MLLIDYLYIDTKRVNSYSEQINKAVIYDKIPDLSVGLSLAGPKIGAKQNNHRREANTPERIKSIQEHLTQYDYINTVSNDSLNNFEKKPFIIEELMAIKVIFPKDRLIPTLWLSIKNNCFILLLEDYYESDLSVDLPLSHQVSAYSNLMFRLSRILDKNETDLGNKLFETYSNRKINNLKSNRNKFISGFSWKPHNDFILKNLFKYPKQFFKELDAMASPVRKIRTLSRIRHYGNEFGFASSGNSEQAKGSIIAYPLFISTM